MIIIIIIIIQIQTTNLKKKGTLRGGNEPSRAEPDVNRSGPVIKKEIIGLGLGLDVGFFSEKSLSLRKIFNA